jgi:sortase A
MIVRMRMDPRTGAKHSSGNKILRWSEYLFLLVGFICLGAYLFSVGQQWIYQRYENTRLDETITESKSPTSPASPDVAPPVDPGLIGRVEIPRLNISAIVREGVDSKTLSRAVGHVPQTAKPGEVGNVAIAAHRDTLFRPVRYIRKGDLIRMVTPSGTFNYQVDSTKIVMPSNVEVLKPTRDPAITLITCYPFNYIGSAPKRFIIRARQVNSSAREAS